MTDRDYELELRVMLSDVRERIDFLIDTYRIKGCLTEREKGQWETLTHIENFIEEMLNERNKMDKN